MRKIVQLYVNEIINENKTISDVPTKLKAEVQAELKKLNIVSENK